MGKRLVVKNQNGVYHVVCRTAFQSHKLDDESKSAFIALLKKQAQFSGVEVLTYCVLENHFHLLIKIPYKNKITDKEIIERYRALYGEDGTEYAMPTAMLVKKIKEGGEVAAGLRRQLTSRMQNLSIFVKELKQRFGIWYNRRHQNTGTLWSERFVSILVEDSEEVLALVTAYIDLNPVRLKICECPAEYRYSKCKENHSQLIFEKTSAPSQKLKMDELSIQLSQSVRAMSHGRLIGSQAFIQSHCQQHQKNLKGKSKWLVSSIEKALWICFSLTELHLQKRSTIPAP